MSFDPPRYSDIELLSGRHEVEFGFKNVEAGLFSTTISFSQEDATVVFDAEANHEYEARAQTLPSPGIWETLTGQGHWIGVMGTQDTH